MRNVSLLFTIDATKFLKQLKYPRAHFSSLSLSISRAIFIKLTSTNHSWLRHNENKLTCCIFLYFYTQGIGKSYWWHFNWSNTGMEATEIFCMLHGVPRTLQCLRTSIELKVSFYCYFLHMISRTFEVIFLTTQRILKSFHSFRVSKVFLMNFKSIILLKVH